MSVYGTGVPKINDSGFSWESDYLRYPLAHALAVLSGSAPGADFPAPVCAYALQPAIPSAGRSVTPPSPLLSLDQYGNINPFFLRLRPSATP